MELLHPHHPPQLHGLSSPSRFLSPETAGIEAAHSSEKLYIAVGEKVEKALSLLQWSFKQFGGCEFCLLHIHKPSPLIPTLLGKLPASQANNEMVNAHRGEEKAKMRRLLDIYLTACARAKVKASVLVTEAELVPIGIVELVNRHCVKKLVMGDVPGSCMKVRSSRKVDYASRKAPPFCEIWFVIKGKQAWVREAFESREVSSPRSFRLCKDCLCSRSSEARRDAEISKHEPFSGELDCRKLELKVIEAVDKVKVIQFAHAHQIKLTENAESELKSIINQQEKLLEEKEELSRRLQRTTRNVALLNGHALGATRRCKEVLAELQLVELSIVELRLEKQKIQRHKLEAKCWIERWKIAGSLMCNEFVQISGEGMLELAEFSLSELESATFCFSESFKLGQGGNSGCIYKGEMMDRTVARKRLHPHNIQLQQEFQQEVQALSKLQHPHLVTLFGYCPEACSLMYEYLPNGNLQDQFFRKTNIHPLSWVTRTRIIAEISSALCFLHSINPERMLHGDLKPENIFLDSKLTSKICDFGICRLVFNEEANGRAFPYTDPEFNRSGVLTPKSDIYSFGIIILQMLTGKPHVGLVGQVRKALSLENLASVLDIKAREWPIFVARQLANISLRCCEMNSKDIPDLTPALVRELEQLHAPQERVVPSFYLCPIIHEIMHDPQITQEGFTYEGEAIQSWFRNGHETSSMTNMKLSCPHLMPNHGLRLAIQDWLCKS